MTIGNRHDAFGSWVLLLLLPGCSLLFDTSALGPGAAATDAGSAEAGDAAADSDEAATPGDVLDSLLLYYKFDEDVAFSAADSSGRGNTGAMHGGIGFTSTSHRGRALNFGGTDGYVDVGNIGPVSAWTITVWVNAAIIGPWRCVLDANSSDFAPGPRIHEGTNAGGILEFDLSDSTSLIGTLPVNTWHHVAIAANGKTVNVYYDGAFKRALPIPSPVSLGSFVIGTGNENGQPGTFFAGILDEVRVYSRVLSNAEVARVYAQ